MAASSNAAVTAPNVPIGVAPPGGITIPRRADQRSRAATSAPANGTSITERSRRIGHPVAINAPAFSLAHALPGCGNTMIPASSPTARACNTVAIAWF